MRYSIVTETYPPEVNCVALTVQALEQGLRARGHHVSLVRPRQSDGQPSLEYELLVRGAGLPRYPGMKFGFPATRKLIRLWRDAPPDAIYVATEGPLGWSAVRAAKRLGIPAASGFHTRFDEYMRDYGAAFLQQTALRWMRRFHNGADATLVPTRELADFLQSQGFDNVLRLSRAVDSAISDPDKRDEGLREQWGIDGTGLVAIHIGRIAPEKNLDLAVRAFRCLQRSHPDARFVWVGDGPARAKLAQDNPDFIFCGVQRGDDVARHFASGDLFVFPSRSETFGNVTLEAMASGVATVAFNYGAAREYLRDGVHGAAIADGDDDAFVAACVRLADDVPHAWRRALLHAQPCSDCGRNRWLPISTTYSARLRNRGNRMRASPRHKRFVDTESNWCVRANGWATRNGWRNYFAAVSRLGDGAFWYGLMAVMVLLDGMQGLRASAHLAATGVIALTLYKVLKRWTRRPRPFASDVRIRAWVAPLDEFSFPSGHTLHAVAFTLVALAHYPLLACVLIPFTASVAVSRVVLGLHYPSDVLAATGIGTALAALALWMVPGVSLFA